MLIKFSKIDILFLAGKVRSTVFIMLISFLKIAVFVLAEMKVGSAIFKMLIKFS